MPRENKLIHELLQTLRENIQYVSALVGASKSKEGSDAK